MTLIVSSVAIIIVQYTFHDASTKPVALESAEHSVRQAISFFRSITGLSTQCDIVLEKIRQAKKLKMQTVVAKKPPWFELTREQKTDIEATTVDSLQTGRSTNRSMDRPHTEELYVRTAKAHMHRLGNQLFNYAALFGVAWRNQRIPLWPARPTQVSNAFQLRVPLDVNKLASVSHARFSVYKCYNKM